MSQAVELTPELLRRIDLEQNFEPFDRGHETGNDEELRQATGDEDLEVVGSMPGQAIWYNDKMIINKRSK